MPEGPRWGPKPGPTEQLVVLCHGIGANGHDLIDLAPCWATALPHALFVAPDAPDPFDGWSDGEDQLASGAAGARRGRRRGAERTVP
jgi:phospholipase/carboxylesterase